MQKRHGIVVGVTILIVALAITMISSMLKKKEEVKDKQPPLSVSQDNGSTTNGGNVKPSNTNSSSNSSEEVSNKGGNPVVVEDDVTKPGANTNSNNSSNTSDNTSVFEVSEDIVANPTDVLNEIMLVSSKKVMLLDLDVNSNENKQMVYVIDMLSADGKKVSLYVNGVVYDDLKVGDTLNIHYNKYVNKNGVEIPLVLQATKTTTDTDNG